MAKKSYTEKQKSDKLAKATAMRKEGKSWDEIAKAVGLARLTLFNWMHPGKAKRAAKGKVRRATKVSRRVRKVTIFTPNVVVEAALQTPEAQKGMLQKIRDWADRELAKF